LGLAFSFLVFGMPSILNFAMRGTFIVHRKFDLLLSLLLLLLVVP
jgi:hypothetical protein